MLVKCELWTNDPNIEVGQYEFGYVPREGELVSFPKGDDYKFVQYRVGDVAHRANGPRHPASTYVFVSKVG